MAEKLWFIYEDGLPSYVYQTHMDAMRALRELSMDVSSGDLDLQAIPMGDLEEYEDDYRMEYDLAMDEDFI